MIESIRNHSEVEQRHYANTKENPSNYASRRVNMGNKNKVQRWFLGTNYLRKPKDT